MIAKEEEEFDSNHITDFDAENRKSQNENFQPSFEKRKQLRRDTLILKQPQKCFSDGRTHCFSEIFNRGPAQRFPTVKVDTESLKNCLASIVEERVKETETKQKKMNAFYEIIKGKAEIEVPDMQFLSKVKSRIKDIVKKQNKKVLVKL